MVETRFDKIVVRSKLPTPFASAEAFGAGAGRALQRTGAVMANVADKALVEIDRQKQKDAVNKGMQFENSLINCGAKGKQRLSDAQRAGGARYDGSMGERRGRMV